MDTGTTHSLRVRSLSIGYAPKAVARPLAFSLQAQTLCGIVGRNGSGKSTLLRTLAGLQPKLSGSISVQHTNLEALSRTQLAQTLSVVLTEPPAAKAITVEELVALGRQPYTSWMGTLTRQDRERIAQTLKTFYLHTLRHRKCHELSDGQRQRVLIARAVVQDTPLILLDEPTTHLDLYHKVQIVTLLQRLAHQHQKTIVFTTHEIDLAIQLCDRILMLDGAANPFGTPCELIQQNHFERLFPEEMIRFDAQTGTFKVTQPSRNAPRSSE